MKDIIRIGNIYDEEKKEYYSAIKNSKNNKQIEKDIKRTFTKEQGSLNLNILNNVLKSISGNKYIDGYCQVINFIVGFLLKVTKFDEIKTYYILKSILIDIKGLFEDDFPLLKKYTIAFNIFFEEVYPKLYKHFENNEIYNELWVSKWLQALFTITLPFEEVCIIWDNLIINGFRFSIAICLSVIDFIEKDLLQLQGSSDILTYFQNLLKPKDIIPIEKNKLYSINDHIIPLNEIIYKAYKIKQQIKEKNNIILEKSKSAINIQKKSSKNIGGIKKPLTKKNIFKNSDNNSLDKKTIKSKEKKVNEINSIKTNTSPIKLNTYYFIPNKIYSMPKNIYNFKTDKCYNLNYSPNNNNYYNNIQKNRKTYNLFDNIILSNTMETNNRRSLRCNLLNNSMNKVILNNHNYHSINYNNNIYNAKLKNDTKDNKITYINNNLYYK